MQEINDNFDIKAPKHFDDRYQKEVAGVGTPYDSVAEANSEILEEYRYLGLTVLITDGSLNSEYWYKEGIEDNDLVSKETGDVNINTNFGDLEGNARDNTDLASELDARISYVDTISDLLNFVRYDSTAVFVKDSLRGGLFRFSQTETDDNGVIFSEFGGGHWVRQFSQSDGVKISWWGVKGDGTDETALFQSTINTCISNGYKLLSLSATKDYHINRINLYDSPDGFTIDGNYAIITKTVGTSDAVIVIAGQTKDIFGITIKNLILDGNAANQTTKAPGSTGFPYPISTLFGTTAVSYSTGEFPTGTAVLISEGTYYLHNVNFENITLQNWGKNGIYGAARQVNILNLYAKNVMLHPVGITMGDRSLESSTKKTLYVNIDGLYAENCGTCFDISSNVKENLNYYGECNIRGVYGYKIWLNTKISGAWYGNISDMIFNDCGFNPSGTLIQGVSNNRYFAPFKMENSIYRGVTIGNITTYKQNYAMKLVKTLVTNLYITDATCSGVECTDTRIVNLRIDANDTTTANVSLGSFIDTSIDNFYVKNIAYDYNTNILGAGLSARSNYPIYMSNGDIQSIIFDNYSTQQGTFGLLNNNTIRGLRCTSSSILGKQNTTAAATSLTATGVNYIQDCDFLNNCEIGNTTYGGTYFRQGVASSVFRLINTIGVGRFDDELGTHYTTGATTLTDGIKSDGVISKFFDPNINNIRFKVSGTLPSSYSDGVPLGGVYAGAGSPEGSQTATVGSIYRNTSGGIANTLWYKISGSGNTGWAASEVITLGTSGSDFNFTSGVLNLPSASSTNSGKVNTTTQSFSGKKTFLDGDVVIGSSSLSSPLLTISGQATPNIIGTNYLSGGNPVMRSGFNGTDQWELTPADYITFGSKASKSILVQRLSGNVGITAANTVLTSNFSVQQTNDGYGRISVTASSGTVTGVNTQFTNTFKIGDTITANSETHTISAIASDTSMTTDSWTNTATLVVYNPPPTRILFAIKGNGKVALGNQTPTAFLDLKAGNTNVGQGMLKYQSAGSSILTTPEAGVVEYNGTSLFFTPASTRLRTVLTDNTIPSNGQIPIGNATNYTNATLTSGSGINIINASGSITIDNKYTTTTATDADTTISTTGVFYILPSVSANRNLTLPSASTAGLSILIWNKNTSGSFTWSFSSTVFDAASSTITTLTNTVFYRLISDGTRWVKTN